MKPTIEELWKMIELARTGTQNIVHGIEDHSDYSTFNSMGDADWLREIAATLENFCTEYHDEWSRVIGSTI